MAGEVNVALLLLLVCVFDCVSSQVLNLIASYPNTSSDGKPNYGIVCLSCEGTFGDPVAADFTANDSLILPNSDLVTVLNRTDGSSYILFSFVASQEGFFKCNTSEHSSDATGLAAPPSINYNANRSIVFQTLHVTREIELECAIKPGALPELYSVVWETRTLVYVSILDDMTTFDIPVEANLSISEQYLCKVSIEHKPGEIQLYLGPIINIIKRVLGSIDNEIHNISITEGERDNFTCQFTSHGNNVRVYWTVGSNVTFECGSLDEGVDPEINGCYGNDGESVLIIQTTAQFGVGHHFISCVLDQNLPNEFTEDPSFEDEFDDMLMTGAFLVIELAGPPRLLVNRPTANNLSFVRLSCVDASMTDIRGAIFFRDGAELTTSSSQVTIMGNSGNGEVLFTFTQEQEGLFHCESSGLASIAVGLAAPPSENYRNKTRQRYIVFQARRTVTITCDIEPGQLTEQYSVKWFDPVQDELINGSVNTYNLPVPIGVSDRPQYQCRVMIEHMNGSESSIREYSGANIILNQKVLTTIVGEIKNVSVDQGNSAELKCQTSNESDDITVYWCVGGDRYDCMASSADDVIDKGCYGDGSINTLFLRDTDSLPEGHYPVQCVVDQNLPSQFTNDPSFDDSFSSVSRNGTLTINKPGLSTVVVAGAVAGAVLLVVILVAVCVCILCYRSRRKKNGNRTNGSRNGRTPVTPSSRQEQGRRESYEMKSHENDVANRRQSSSEPPDTDNRHRNSSTGEMTAADRAPPLDQQSSTGTQPDASATAMSPGIDEAGPGTQEHTSPTQAQPRGRTTVQFSELANELEDVASLWYSLGLELGISCNTLDGIKGETNMPSIILRRILQSWLQNSEVHLRTKKNLVEILKRNPIRNNRLAAKIENNNDIPAEFGEEALYILHRELTKELASKYQSFGIQLDLELPAIEALLRPRVSVSECLCCMLDEWRKGGNCNLNDVIAALGRDVVGRKALAEKLQAKWRDCHC